MCLKAQGHESILRLAKAEQYCNAALQHNIVFSATASRSCQTSGRTSSLVAGAVTV